MKTSSMWYFAFGFSLMTAGSWISIALLCLILSWIYQGKESPVFEIGKPNTESFTTNLASDNSLVRTVMMQSEKPKMSEVDEDQYKSSAIESRRERGVIRVTDAKSLKDFSYKSRASYIRLD
jgi:hypothetical protein